MPQVREIIAEAQAGEAAILEHCLRFDGVKPTSLRVPTAVMEASLRELSDELREAIVTSIDRVRRVTEASLPSPSRVELEPGAIVTQRWQPVGAVGLYAPGGKAVYPSSVIMNAVPAQAAKVPRIALASPPQPSGWPHPTILATAQMLGIAEVYAVGGASAIAAFAYGVAGVLEPVDLVTGPGNVFVAAAKRELRGVIGIDSEAGPTEIMILADETATAGWLAADLISQAEHDENAAAVLVTTSFELAYAVNAELERQLAVAPNQLRATAALNGPQSAIAVVESLDDAIAVADHYATEHLEIHTRDAAAVASRISNAGAIFVGQHSPVSLGDYLAGSNHVLPTGGAARFSSALGVHTFLRPQQLIEYTPQALEALNPLLTVFSEAEGLPAHGAAARERFQEH
jgi:histidinol dehydrogenase